MDKTVIDPMQQMRSFDFVSFEHDVVVGFGDLIQDLLSGSLISVVAGLVAAQTGTPSLSFTIGSGRVYSMAQVDGIAIGSVPQDSSLVCMQGIIQTPRTLTLVAPGAGQSQWNLVQCQFAQQDVVRPGDPNGGTVPFYNPLNPTVPNVTSINTCRQGNLILQVITGAAATTGSEIPPTPTNGWTPLYLVDLAGGQVSITTAQILRSGPSVGVGVPNGYPIAPFLPGLLASHHGGTPGQAPKINLGTETTGVLPYPNMSPVRQLLGAALTLYVNSSTGLDTNSGLSPTSPFRTIQAAANAGYRNYDFNGNALTISVANGTYNVVGSGGSFAVIFSGMPLGCTQVNLTGNAGSPGSVLLSVTNGNGIASVFGASVFVSGMTITASGTNQGILVTQGYGVYATYGGFLAMSNCVIGSCGTLQFGAGEGYMVLNGPITLTGTTQFAFVASLAGLVWINGQVITSSGLTVSVAFANASQTGIVQAQGVTFVGTPTGARFLAQSLGQINTAGGGVNYFPGTVAGSGTTAAASPYGLYL